MNCSFEAGDGNYGPFHYVDALNVLRSDDDPEYDCECDRGCNCASVHIHDECSNVVHS